MSLSRRVALVLGAVGLVSCPLALGQEEGAIELDDPIAKALQLSQATGAPILAVAGTET
jgi:hypothetical protein